MIESHRTPRNELELRARNVLDNKSYSVRIKDGITVECSASEDPDEDCRRFFIPGGLIDTQVNGYLGNDYSAPDFSSEQAREISVALARKGTLQHFPTIVTRPQRTILRSIREIVKATRQYEEARSSISGIHIEGPFLSNEEGPRGAHDPLSLRAANIKEFEEWKDAAEGLLRVITLAPEAEGAIELIKYAVRHGVVCAIGHTGADKKQIDAAFAAGATVSTHLGNGVHARLDRFHNPIWPQLTNPHNTISVIADGAHVDADLIAIFAKCKDPDHIMLVSDLAPVAGLTGKNMKWGDLNVDIASDGSVWISGAPYLAGAGSSLFQNVFNYSKFTNADLSSAFRLCTTNPAACYHLDRERHIIACGKTSELVSFTLDEAKNGVIEKVFTLQGELL